MKKGKTMQGHGQEKLDGTRLMFNWVPPADGKFVRIMPHQRHSVKADEIPWMHNRTPIKAGCPVCDFHNSLVWRIQPWYKRPFVGAWRGMVMESARRLSLKIKETFHGKNH